jgi:hypothetical protein
VRLGHEANASEYPSPLTPKNNRIKITIKLVFNGYFSFSENKMKLLKLL